MKSFWEFLEDKGLNELKIMGIIYKPNNCVPSAIPKTGFRNSGATKMFPLASVAPSKPYQPLFRLGSQKKGGIMGKKH